METLLIYLSGITLFKHANMKKYILLLMVILPMAILLSCNKIVVDKTPVDYVNPYIGNISHLLVPTFPTVHLPNSLLRIYPERRENTTDYISGLPVVVTSHRGAFCV